MGIAACIGGAQVAADAYIDSPDFPMCDTMLLRCRFQDFTAPTAAPLSQPEPRRRARGLQASPVARLGCRQALGLGMMPRRKIVMGVGCAGTPQDSEAVRPRSDLTSLRTMVGVYANIVQPNRREVG